MEKFFVTLWMLFGIYILVLVMILADLWSGVRKAKRLGEVRTSYGYKRTVGKLAQYYNVLIALTIVDGMQMSSVWYFERYYGNSIWFFPFMTLGGALLLCLIEVKSIYEKAEDKVRMDKAGQVVSKIILNREDKEEIAKTIHAYLNDEEDSESKSTRKKKRKRNGIAADTNGGDGIHCDGSDC